MNTIVSYLAEHGITDASAGFHVADAVSSLIEGKTKSAVICAVVFGFLVVSGIAVALYGRYLDRQDYSKFSEHKDVLLILGFFVCGLSAVAFIVAVVEAVAWTTYPTQKALEWMMRYIS